MRVDVLRCAFTTMLLYATAAYAQERSSPKAPGSPSVTAAPAAGEHTGKERLGRKWTDEQRIDNCKVPPGLRGSKARPDKCRNGPST